MTAGLTRGLGASRCDGPSATGGVVTGVWGNPSKFEIIGAGASGEARRGRNCAAGRARVAAVRNERRIDSVAAELALESDELPPKRKSRPKIPVSSPEAGASPSRQDDKTERSQKLAT